MEINSIQGPDLGAAIYLGQSLFKHSCEPNAVQSYVGKKLSIRATQEIKDFNWSKATICYIDRFTSPEERRSVLEKSYHFTCKCEPCLTEKNFGKMTGLACPDAKCEGYIDKNSQNCNICNEAIDEKVKESAKAVCELSEKLIATFKMGVSYQGLALDMNSVNKCLSKQKKLLHKYHYLHAIMLQCSFYVAYLNKPHDDALRIGNELLDVYRFYYGDVQQEIGKLHLRLSGILKKKKVLKAALDHKHKGENIFKIIYGDGDDMQEMLTFFERENLAFQLM